MRPLPPLSLALTAALALVAAAAPRPAASLAAETLRCRLVPGSVLALVAVERDTTLPFAVTGVRSISRSTFGPAPRDSLLAQPGTPMPAGRVRLVDLDSATRRILADSGITGERPVAFIRAAPYRHDCRVERWTDTARFAVAGDTGFVRAELAPRDQWVDGAPVLVVSDSWYYPYPRRRGLARGATADAPLASPAAMFDLVSRLEVPAARTREERIVADSIRRVRALAWIAANPEEAECEPARTTLRGAVLDADWEAARSRPSRLRGSYRVVLDATGARSSWFFRTWDRPGYRWVLPGRQVDAATLAASPWVTGYTLTAHPAPSRDSLPMSPPRPAGLLAARAWLSADDRPTAPDNESRRALVGRLEFDLGAVPEALWDGLDPWVVPLSAIDSSYLARTNGTRPREQRQVRLPLTLRLDDRGRVRADTTLSAEGRRVHVTLERVDTVSLARPFQ